MSEFENGSDKSEYLEKRRDFEEWWRAETGEQPPEIEAPGRLAEGRLDQLRIKQAEYAHRLEQVLDGSREAVSFASDKAKFNVIDAYLGASKDKPFGVFDGIEAAMPDEYMSDDLVRAGLVNIYRFYNPLKSDVDEDKIEKTARIVSMNAFLIVKDYAETGGENLEGGTGLL